MSIKAIVTDIEGTTTSVSFVFDVLFPYAKERLPAFIREHAGDAAVREQLAAVSKEVDRELSDDEVVAELLAWIEADRKATPLKALQGLVWTAGYESGAFKGHVYDDAAEHLRKWHADGMKLFVYSSGSVKAQKLLFGHSDHGDLTSLFSGYFDTTTGPKRDADSYRKIVAEIGLPASDILFLSDVEAELSAASAAGMKTAWLVREGEVDDEAFFHQYASFADIPVG